ncbi:MAG: hypothetical protein HQL34_06640 [Alphaproteobacteria bacterium]|nr:hypothetical protein [Alphaproteobacteria bacterium]
MSMPVRLMLALLLLLAAPARAGTDALPNAFAEKGFGYTLRYPGNWTLSRPGGYAVVIGGGEGSPQAKWIVGIDNRLSPQPGKPVAGANAIFEQYLNEVRASASQPIVERQAPFSLGRKGKETVGFQAVVQFNGNTERLSQWAVVVPRKSGTIVHIWTFTAPIETFAQALPTARAILESWSLLPDEKAAEKPEGKPRKKGGGGH